jgi:hypothetical protein
MATTCEEKLKIALNALTTVRAELTEDLNSPDNLFPHPDALSKEELCEIVCEACRACDA